MEESILTSVKKHLGIMEEYTHFDDVIIEHINTVFFTLKQMGVGPKEGFYIEDDKMFWEDYIEDPMTYQAVKSYMQKKVQLLFDPPLSSAHIEAINRQIAELEWRLNFEAELDTT